MLRKCFYLCFFVLTYLVSPCYAAPSYGTRMPEKNQFHLSGQTYWVQQRNLEDENGKIKSLQHFLLISYGITDWFSLDLKGGAGDTHQTPDGGNEISYPAYMAGGYGCRVKLYDQEKTKAVFGFQHISVHPYSVFIGNVKHKAVIDDWQISFLASRVFEYAMPYLGMRWSRMDSIHWVEDDRNRVKSDLNESIGFIAGIDVPVHEKVWLNFEGQFLDAQAAAASIHFRF
ncbi:MAG: hypothetical protein KAS66_01445 [Candidatus Omnitrophica bacterium]|nr:hypothetical protein [Candidatus Omnitrophota bacterium]